MNIDNFKQIIQGYLDGKANDKESARVDSWYHSIAKDNINPFKHSDHRKEVKQDIFSGIERHSLQQNKRKIRISRLTWFSAAAILLAVASSAVFFLQREQAIAPWGPVHGRNLWTHIATKAGESRKITLRDGTSIFLNGNTHLRYDDATYVADRKVFLDSGEAFFQVKRDTSHPFQVETGPVSVEVLGTSFNIAKSEASKKVTVEVKTGRVRVANQAHKERHILTPGKGGCYSQSENQVELFDLNPSHVNLWTQGGMLLTNVGFAELKEIIYNRYAVVLTADGIDTEKFNYSLMIPQVQSLDQVLRMICTIHQIKFRREKNEVTLYQ